MTEMLNRVKIVVEEYLTDLIDLEVMQLRIVSEMRNIENIEVPGVCNILLQFEACIEDVRFTVSDCFQKREIKKYYVELLLPLIE